MPLRTLLTLTLLASLAACGGSDSADTGDTTGLTADAEGAGDEAADVEEQAPAARPDSIPMQITVVTSGGRARNNGTYTARGNGSQCSHDPDARAGQVAAEWTVGYSSEDTAATVNMVNLMAGKTEGGKTSALRLLLTAGTMEGAGMKMPMTYSIGTYPGGATDGSGTVTAAREGDGVRLTLDGTAGGNGTRMRMTIVCEKLGTAG